MPLTTYALVINTMKNTREATAEDMGDAASLAQWPTFEGLGDGSDGALFTVPPKPMAELHEQYHAANKVKGAESVQTVEEMKAERLEAFKIKVQKQEKMER